MKDHRLILFSIMNQFRSTKRIAVTIQVMALIISFGVILGCRRNEKEFVRNTVNKIGAAALVAEGSAPTAPRAKDEGLTLDLTKIPESFAAFKPIEIIDKGPEAYLIVTARHVQHRTGLYISRPDEVVPKSTKYLIYDPIAPRLYFYQD